MTTERPVPRLTLTTQEWRLVLTAGLAATYVLAWVAFGTHLPSPGTRRYRRWPPGPQRRGVAR